MENDRLVWAMLDAETQQATEIPAHRIEPRSPGRALLMDLVLGAMGLWALSAQRPAIGLDSEAFAGLASDVQAALLAVLLAPVVSMLAVAFAHRRTEGGHDDLEFRAGTCPTVAGAVASGSPCSPRPSHRRRAASGRSHHARR